MYEKSVELLNLSIGDEMAAAHQYMYFHFHCDDMGLDLLSMLFKRTAIEEMMHIEILADRVLFLKGEIEMTPNKPVEKITDVKAMLDWAVASETGAILQYNKWALECSAHADSTTKKLFEQLVGDEERHFSQFDDELANMAKFGPNYLALQSIERSKATSMLPLNRPGGGGTAG